MELWEDRRGSIIQCREEGANDPPSFMSPYMHPPIWHSYLEKSPSHEQNVQNQFYLR
jgi:hypothetical protein